MRVTINSIATAENNFHPAAFLEYLFTGREWSLRHCGSDFGNGNTQDKSMGRDRFRGSFCGINADIADRQWHGPLNGYFLPAASTLRVGSAPFQVTSAVGP